MGDRIEEIYNEHARSVYKFLLALSHDADTAEELTQETSIAPYILSTIMTVAVKYRFGSVRLLNTSGKQELRKRSRYAAQELTADIPDSVTLEQSVLLTSDKLSLYKAIHALSEPMREVVHMRLPASSPFLKSGKSSARAKTGHGQLFTGQSKK